MTADRRAALAHDITQEQLKEMIHYDPDTGIFTWVKPLPSCNIRPGTVAGSLRHTGYVRLEINGRTYTAHRLAWLYVTGEWPSNIIDHIDNCRNNNRFANLRLADPHKNSCNRRTNSNNTSGYKGVSWSAKCQKWQAGIKVNGKKQHLGMFDTKQDAHAALVAVRVRLHGEFANHGTPMEPSND